MYIVKRSEKITETLCLQASDGSKKNIDIVIDVDLIALEFVKRREAFLNAQRKMTALQKAGRKDDFENAYIEYGDTLIDFFTAVFGKENTLRIAEFFENRYIEMMMQLFPFINEKITPAIKRSVGYTKKQLAKQWRIR